MADQNRTTVSLTIVEKPIGKTVVRAVSARELHAELGIKKDFSDWLHQHTSKGDWYKDNDFSVFPLEGEIGRSGRQAMDAALSLEMAEHIARYYTPVTIADAYDEVTRQLRFLIHDPGVKYRSKRRA